MSYNYLARKHNGKKIDVHKFIWEQANGKVPKGYVVHHIDEDKHNNELSNLQMMTRKEHLALHGFGHHDLTPEQYARRIKSCKETWSKKANIIIDGKTLCKRCNKMLFVDRFTKNKKSPNGCEPFCRECRSEFRKEQKQLGRII